MTTEEKIMEFNEYLQKLFSIGKRTEELNFFADAAKLTKTEFRLLREIVAEGEKGKNIISSELARRLGITRSAISQIVTRLEARGNIIRKSSPTDRKIFYVCLSERTYAIYDEQCKQANEIMDLVLADLGEERVQALIAESEEFIAALGRARKVYAHNSAR